MNLLLIFLTITLSIGNTLIAAQSPDRAFLFCTQTPGSVAVAQSNQPSSIDCAARCAQAFPGQISYSFYREQNLACLCSTTLPNLPKRTSKNGQPDVCQTSGSYSVYRIGTSFRFDQCYSGRTTSTSIEPRLTTTNIEDCFNLCRSYSTLVIQPLPAANAGASPIVCFCPSPDITFSPPAQCNSSGFFYRYTHSSIAVASMLVRRKQQRLSKPESYCPAGLTACKVPGISASYECVDTSSELEACGGCGAAGEFGTALSTTVGVNCMDQPGAAWGTTSLQGKCVNYR